MQHGSERALDAARGGAANAVARSVVRTAFALPSVRAGIAACSALGVALATIPLLGVHGVESALALGALVPPLAAAVSARIAIAARKAKHVDGWSLAGAASAASLALLAAPVLVLALNALRVRNCAPLDGLTFIFLGPGMGVALAALLGACIGALPLAPALATTLALLVPVADMLRAAYDFYATPAVFAYGHFFGYLPGSLYDELVQLPFALITLRFFSLGLWVALLCVLTAHFDPTRRGLRIWPQPGSSFARALGALCLLVAGYGLLRAEAFGHRTSVETIAKALGARAWSQRCELIVPRELHKTRRQRLAQDCDFRVSQLERWFGVRQALRVRVFVFRSADEKRALMGASDTNIAKPWRREIYLQDEAFPHSVMPHELAHIVAGNFGRGPLRISGKLQGLIPDFALIEGTAVAGAWASSMPSGLTPHQWTRAMLELGIAPKLSAVFGAGFLEQQRRLAYTVSGSLLRYIAETHGKASLRRIYSTGDVEGVLGIALPELEQRFHAYLRTVPLPDSALALARLRFSGSSILSSVCPHVKAELRAALEGELAAGDGVQAAADCARLLAIDPAETGARATLVAVLARRGDLAGAGRELSKLAGPPAAAPPLIAGARHALADEAWRNGQLDRAAAIYHDLLAQPNERDVMRMLQVKALALAGRARERDLLFSLLVGEPGQATDGATAVYLARELRDERSDGLPHYLEARQLVMRERYADAVSLLEQARARTLPTREIEIEALRIEGLARFAISDLAGAQARFAELERDPNLAQQVEARDWLARIAFAYARR